MSTTFQESLVHFGTNIKSLTEVPAAKEMTLFRDCLWTLKSVEQKTILKVWRRDGLSHAFTKALTIARLDCWQA